MLNAPKNNLETVPIFTWDIVFASLCFCSFNTALGLDWLKPYPDHEEVGTRKSDDFGWPCTASTQQFAWKICINYKWISTIGEMRCSNPSNVIVSKSKVFAIQ